MCPYNYKTLKDETTIYKLLHSIHKHRMLGANSLQQRNQKKDNMNKQNQSAEVQTIANMQEAYKGEKTASAKYEAFSIKAEAEGYHQICLLYQAVSEAENIHAANHKMVIEDAGAAVPLITPEYKLGSTKENLSNGIQGEAYESETMYPNFIKTAETAHMQTAALSLTYAMKTELKHNAFFEQTLKAINGQTLNQLPKKYYVCPDCGNTYAASAPKHCDFSLTSADKFIIFQ